MRIKKRDNQRVVSLFGLPLYFNLTKVIIYSIVGLKVPPQLLFCSRFKSDMINILDSVLISDSMIFHYQE